MEKQVRERSWGATVERFKRTQPQFVISHAKPQPSIRTVTTYDVVWDVRRFFHPIVEHNLIAFCELIDRAYRFIKDQPGASDCHDYVREIYRTTDRMKAQVRTCAFRSVDVLAQVAQRIFRGERDKEKLRDETNGDWIDCGAVCSMHQRRSLARIGSR